MLLLLFLVRCQHFLMAVIIYLSSICFVFKGSNIALRNPESKMVLHSAPLYWVRASSCMTILIVHCFIVIDRTPLLCESLIKPFDKVPTRANELPVLINTPPLQKLPVARPIDIMDVCDSKTLPLSFTNNDVFSP